MGSLAVIFASVLTAGVFDTSDVPGAEIDREVLH